MTEPFLYALIGALTALVMPISIATMRRYAMDSPNERSSHTVPTPRAGGIPIMLGVAVSVGSGAAATQYDYRAAAGVLVVGLIFGTIGVLDDLVTLSAAPRLGLQLATAAGYAAWVGAGQAVWLVLGVLWIVGCVNAFNFMDGINGISCAVAITGFATYGWLFASSDRIGLAVLSFALATSTAAFAPFNVPVAASFLGDGGSYFLGATLGCLSLALITGGTSPSTAVAPLALYFADSGATLLRRAVHGENVFSAHRDHTYQRLAREVGHLPTAAAFGVVTALLVVLTTTQLWPESWYGVVVVGGLAFALVFAARLTTLQRAAV